MKLHTLNNFNFKGKKVLVRADLNSPVVKGKVLMNDRIKESAKTLQELKKKGARVVVLAHQSAPGRKDFISLEQHAKLLDRFVRIKFVEDILGRKARNEIDKLKEGEILLLDNIRKLREEFSPSVRNKVVQQFKEFDIFINDAFSVSHRNHTSIVSFARIMKSCVGRLFEKELRCLEKLRVGDCLFVLGGVKIEEVVSLIDEKRRILAGGLLGPLVLYANGQRFGKMDSLLKKHERYLGRLRNPKRVVPAIDYSFNIDGRRKEMMLDELPCKYEALDIGSRSVEIFVNEIKKAKAVFVKGPMGQYEDPLFSKGTKEILRAVSKCKFSVVGGGHTSSAIKELGFSKGQFSYVSLSGGATVEYILGKRLPGVEALRKEEG